MADVSATLETELREFLVELMPVEHAPAHLRLAFHDAGTYDRVSHTGGANGTVRLPDELRRSGNTGWGHTCFELLAEAKAAFPQVSWADLIAIGAAAAIQKCGGPVLFLGLGRRDASTPAAPNRLPNGFEGPLLLKSTFARMGLDLQDLVVLSGAHTLGFTLRRPFTLDPLVFSNSYFVELAADPGHTTLPTDTALMSDPELRAHVQRYAQDEAVFQHDFARALRKLSWLGYGDAP